LNIGDLGGALSLFFFFFLFLIPSTFSAAKKLQKAALQAPGGLFGRPTSLYVSKCFTDMQCFLD
jgi:hypothetical protein